MRLKFQFEVIAFKKTTDQHDYHDDDLDLDQQQHDLDHSTMISSTFDKHHHHRHRYHDDGTYVHHHHQQQKSKIPLLINVIAVTDDDDDHSVLNDTILLVYTNLTQLSDSLQKPKCYVYPVSNITVTHTFMHHRYGSS